MGNASSSLKGKAKGWLARVPGLYRTASAAYRSLSVAEGMAYVARQAPTIMMGSRPIVVDYARRPQPRWGHGRPSHAGLAALLEGRRAPQEQTLRAFAAHRAAYERIPDSAPADSGEPRWDNPYFSGLDAIALYGMLGTLRPSRYFEIGSGNSTKFARQAIVDQGLQTTVLSIDPAPRAAIDALCDTVIRQPLEEVDPSVFAQLGAGDILFFDGSHHAFMGSDVVVLFTEVLPRLRPGVIVHIHDIFLPDDYPADWAERYYTEQYLLAVALLGRAPGFEVLLANHFVGNDSALAALALDQLGPRVAGTPGSSFWIRSTGAPES